MTQMTLHWVLHTYYNFVTSSDGSRKATQEYFDFKPQPSASLLFISFCFTLHEKSLYDFWKRLLVKFAETTDIHINTKEN